MLHGVGHGREADCVALEAVGNVGGEHCVAQGDTGVQNMKGETNQTRGSMSQNGGRDYKKAGAITSSVLLRVATRCQQKHLRLEGGRCCASDKARPVDV